MCSCRIEGLWSGLSNTGAVHAANQTPSQGATIIKLRDITACSLTIWYTHSAHWNGKCWLTSPATSWLASFTHRSVVKVLSHLVEFQGENWSVVNSSAMYAAQLTESMSLWPAWTQCEICVWKSFTLMQITNCVDFAFKQFAKQWQCNCTLNQLCVILWLWIPL